MASTVSLAPLSSGCLEGRSVRVTSEGAPVELPTDDVTVNVRYLSPYVVTSRDSYRFEKVVDGDAFYLHPLQIYPVRWTRVFGMSDEYVIEFDNTLQPITREHSERANDLRFHCHGPGTYRFTVENDGDVGYTEFEVEGPEPDHEPRGVAYVERTDDVLTVVTEAAEERGVRGVIRVERTPADVDAPEVIFEQVGQLQMTRNPLYYLNDSDAEAVEQRMFGGYVPEWRWLRQSFIAPDSSTPSNDEPLYFTYEGDGYRLEVQDASEND